MSDELMVGFRFHCDLTKSEEGTVRGERVRYVEGEASLESPDQQGETIVQKGINFGPLLATGHLNWDHGPVRRGSPAYIIGEPTHAEVNHSKRHGCDAFFIKGFLYNDPENKPIADDAWKHMQALKKSGSQRSMGFSVEGTTNLKIGSKIHKSTIYHVALTHAPVHQDSRVGFAEVMKSLAYASALDPEVLAGREWDVLALLKAEAGGEGFAGSVSTIGTLQPLLKEDLPHGKRKKKRHMEAAIESLWGSPTVCKGGTPCFDETGHFRNGAPGLLKHLVECRGWEVPDAEVMTTTLVKALW